MAVTTTIDNGYELQRMFERMDRGNHFSHYGYDALYDYLYDLSEDCGQDFHVDVIALCCDFTEYSDWEELYQNYSYSYNNEEKSWEELEEDNETDDFKEWVQDRTIVIECTDYKDTLQGIIIQCF